MFITSGPVISIAQMHGMCNYMKSVQFWQVYLEVATAVVVSAWSWKNFTLCIDIVLIFFSYSGPLGILGSGRKQNTT